MQTVKQVSSRSVLIYVIMQEISILLLVKESPKMRRSARRASPRSDLGSK